MKYTRNIFAVSIMALMAVSTARAEVVATTLLDERLGTTGNLATVAATGSYNDLANKPTIPAAANNATLTIQKNGTTVDTFTANASADKTINIIVPTGTLASKNTVTNTEVADGALSQAKVNGLTSALAGKQDVSNMATTKTGYTDNDDTKYPTIAVAQEIANIAAGSATGELGALAQKDTVSTGLIDDGAVTSAKIADGTITTTDISATADIAKGQLATAVQTSLGKADSALQSVPVATATALGGVKSGGNITVATDGTVTVNQAAKATTADSATSATKATQDASGNNIVNTYATKAQLNALDSTSTGSGAVVTAVSQTDGKVSVTKGNVQIPVGGASGTTYATIWVE